MADQKIHNEVAFLARLAGLTVPEQRLAALAIGFAGTQAICEALSHLDLGTTEPASQFLPPAAQ
jgi:hypothetical protein